MNLPTKVLCRLLQTFSWLFVFEFVNDSKACGAFHADAVLHEQSEIHDSDFKANSRVLSKATVLVGKLYFVVFGMEFLQAIVPKADSSVEFAIKQQEFVAIAVELGVCHDGMARFVQVADGKPIIRSVSWMVVIVDDSRVVAVGDAHAYDGVEKVRIGCVKRPDVVHFSIEWVVEIEIVAADGMKTIPEADFVSVVYCQVKLRESRQHHGEEQA